MTLEEVSSLVPLVTAFVSVVAMIFLLFRLCRLSVVLKSRLLVRQLQCLAIANLVYLGAVCPELMSDLGWFRALPTLTNKQRNTWCVASNFVEFLGAEASMLVECHMAIVFATSIYGAVKTMLLLSTGLPLVWLIALPLALARVTLLKLQWDPEEQGCQIHNKNDSDDFFAVSSAIGFLLCLACYIASACGVYRAGMAVQRSVWKRARLYPLATLVTLGPFIVYYVVVCPYLTTLQRRGELSRRQDVEAVAFLISDTFVNASGFLTFCVYASQSKYVVSSRGQACEQPIAADRDNAERNLDFRVNFRQDDSVVDFGTASPSAMSASRGSTGSLLVEYFDDVAMYGHN